MFEQQDDNKWVTDLGENYEVVKPQKKTLDNINIGGNGNRNNIRVKPRPEQFYMECPIYKSLMTITYDVIVPIYATISNRHADVLGPPGVYVDGGVEDISNDDTEVNWSIIKIAMNF